ncbi:hypothetical protein [Stenotrophomonas maltophilia]|uniref:hypothetical protein n=1 Tax=Stenotrophomonas maltophilia TaxID=40324 RepID=UPI000DA6F2DC|nr:hypothetical protein [Stenotrophomonas maltophilia]PZS55126.1 hypothetical protein A7X58_13495 [Stenotrophomonas maltophilia]
MAVFKEAWQLLKRGWESKSPIAVVVMAQGMIVLLLLLVIILGPTNLQMADDGGSAADWLAALGTWVIGVAAAAIAFIAHRKNVQDAQVEEDRRSEVRRVQRMFVAVELSNAYGLHTLPGGFKEIEPGKQTMPKLRLMHERLMRDSKEIVLSEQYVFCLTTELVVDIKAINNKMESIRELVELQRDNVALRDEAGRNGKLIPWDLKVIDQMEKYGMEIRALCQEIFDRLDKE